MFFFVLFIRFCFWDFGVEIRTGGRMDRWVDLRDISAEWMDGWMMMAWGIVMENHNAGEKKKDNSMNKRLMNS